MRRVEPSTIELKANGPHPDRRLDLAQSFEAEHSIREGREQLSIRWNRVNTTMTGVRAFPQEAFRVGGGAFEWAQKAL